MNKNEKSRWLAKDFNILKGELLEIGISEISNTIVVLYNFIYDDGEDPPMMYSCYKGDVTRLSLPMQSGSIVTEVTSSILYHWEVYSIQPYIYGNVCYWITSGP